MSPWACALLHRSLLLYLDGQTLLFNKIELPIKTRTAHVAIGFAHVLVVTQEGMAYSWGEGGHGQLGHGDTVSRSEPQLVEALRGKSITRCECGGEFSIFLSDNGLIMSVGRGDSGALGHGDFKDCLKPRLLEALLSDDITDVSCGESHVVTVTSDGHVYAWGAGGQGRLGTGTEENKCTPTKVAVQIPNTKTDELVRTVKCGLNGTMFLTSTGRLFASGSNQDNKLGLNQRETFIVQMKKLVNKTQLQVLQMLEPTPVKELGKHRVTDMALGPTHSAVLVETGTVYTFGRNSEGQLCSGNTQPSYIPVMVKSLLPKAWMVTCSELSCIILTEDMKVNVWGSRPIIRTPLADLLSPMATHKPTSDPQSVSADPQPEGQGGLPGVETSSQPPPVPSSPKLPTSLVAPVSTSPAAERKPSSGEIFPTGSQLTSPGGPNGGVARTKSGELQIRRQGSTFFFPDTPHTTYLCSEASRYSAMLKDMLSESLETSRAKVGGGVGAGTRPPQPSSRGVRRGPSMGSSIDLVKAEGVIMRPTPMDLLEISGNLFTPTTKGGQRLVKLEDIACFGSNLLVLIEVQEREGGVRRSSSVQAQLSLGMKLNKKIGFKSRVASPSHKSSPAQPKKEPAHSESATATATAAAKVQDVSLIPLPETKPRADSGTKICNTTSASRSSSEDSYIPPWLKKEVEDALAGKPQPIKAKEGVQAFQSPNPVSPNNAQSSNLSPPNPVPNPQPLPQTVPSNPQTATSNPLPPPQTTLPPPQATQPPPQTAQPLPQITPPNLSTQSTNPQLPKLPPLQPGTKPLNTQSPDLTKQPSISHVHPKVPDSQSPRGGVTSPGGTPPAKKSSKSSRDVSSLGLDTPPKTESQGPKCESQGPKAGGPTHPSAASAAAQNQQAGSKLQQGEPHHGNCEGSASHTLKERNCNSSQNSEKGPEPPNVASPDAQTAVQPATQTNSPQRENNLNVSSDSAEESSEALKTNAKQKTPPLNPRNPKPPPSRGGGARTSSTSVSASSHLRSRSDQVKVPKAMGTSKKSHSASQIPDKMAERVKSPLAPTVEEGSDGEQPASPQNRLASPQSSFDDERQTPDHSGQTPPKTASSGKQGVNRTSAGDLGKKSKLSSNAHKTGHSVEVTTTSPYEAAPNFHPKRPLPQSKRNRTQTAPSKSIHDKHLQVNPFEKPPSDEKPPSNEKEVSNEEVAGPSPDERGGDHLLKGEVERLKTVVEEQNRMLQEGQQVVKELQKKMSEMELQNQPEQSGSPVPSNADPQPASQKRSLFKFKNQDKRVSSKVCSVM